MMPSVILREREAFHIFHPPLNLLRGLENDIDQERAT